MAGDKLIGAVRWAGLAIILSASAAAAGPQAPSPANEAPASAAAPSNASAQSPAAAASPTPASDEGGPFDHLKATDIAVAFLTLGLLIVAGIQAGIYFRQAKIMADALRATAEANNAASRSAKIAEDALNHAQLVSETELRAYVHVGALVTKFDDEGLPVEVQTEIRNYGRTPALNVTFWQGTGVYDIGLSTAADAPMHAFHEPQGSIPLSRSVLPPNGPSVMVSPVGPILAHAVPRWQSGQAAAYAWGEIVYDDCFGQRHFTAFRYFTSAGHSAAGAMSACSSGNIAR